MGKSCHFVECNGGTIELQSGNSHPRSTGALFLKRSAYSEKCKDKHNQGTSNGRKYGKRIVCWRELSHNASMQEIVPGSYKEWTGNHDLQGVEFRRVKNPAVTVPLADLSISVRAGGTKLNMENRCLL